MYYLSHVNYDPTAADLISIRVTIYLGLGGREGRYWKAGRYRKGRRAGTGKGGGPVQEEGVPLQLGLHPPPHMCNIHDQLFYI
jgi:hypothetical protein